VPNISQLQSEIKNFKVVHLSSSTSGGAGIAAKRLNSALKAFGIESTIISLNGSSREEIGDVVYVSRTLSSLILGKISTIINLHLSRMSFFSLFNRPAGNLLTVLRIFSPDTTILHIHNWFNLTDFSELESLLQSGYKIVFTLHDESLFTGGCHYSFSCDFFTGTCLQCPRVPKLLESKVLNNQNVAAAFVQKHLEELKFICPSNWIKSEALRSRVLNHADLVVIPNVFDTLSEVKFDNSCAKKSLVHIGVASVDPWHYSKGGDILKQLIHYSEINSSGLCFHLLSEYSGEDKFARFWSEIDALFVPSRADNSPNVIHESKLYGIPVLASNVGGIPELLDQGIDSVFELSDINYSSIVKDFIRLKSIEQTRVVKSPSETSSDRLQSVQEHLRVYSGLFDERSRS
jgi:glycosyltransferase involved in cell wall biosynthesis